MSEQCGNEHALYGRCTRPPHTDGCHERKGLGGEWWGWASEEQAEQMRGPRGESAVSFGKHEVGPKSTYEIFIDVEHHRRHLEDWAEHERQCWKLVDTGDSREMVVAALREMADQIEEKA